jgi:photosystem II stability/assembly factor-like uncharacterized protein
VNRRTAHFALALLLVTTVAPAQEPPKPREQQVADIEKQLAELRQRLDQLKGTPASDGSLPDDWVKAFPWRCIGPATMGGRITTISAFDVDPTTYWIGTASGGLLKTTNAGTTFAHQFDREATVSVGAVCVAPSNPEIVWVGTGENNPRNSVSIGDGVYKSTNGGQSWTNMGLKKSFQIGKILVNPNYPDTVYAGALGRLYGPSDERGLFKTTDGGKTWKKILYIDDKTGVIDMVMHPTDAETLIIATWERQRDGFDSHPGNEMLPADGYDRYDPIKKWGPGSGLHKTTDGGKTWKKLTAGLPTCDLGRIGLDWYRKDPKVVFAIIDSAKIAMGTPPQQVWLGIQGENATGGAKLTAVTETAPAGKAGLKAGDVVKVIDKKPIENYGGLVGAIQGKKAGDKLVFAVLRDGKTLEITVTLENRPIPPPDPAVTAARLFGATAEAAPAGTAGVKLTRLIPGGSAATAGLKETDLVQAIDKKPVAARDAFVQAVNAHKVGDKITVSVLRDKETKDIVVTLKDPPPGFGPGQATPTRPYGYMFGGQQPNVQDQQGPNSHEYGGVYKSTDGGETWARVNSLNPRPMYFSCIRVDPNDSNYVYVCGVLLHKSKDGGKTFTQDGGNGVHPDQHTLWIDPKDGRHMIVGCDGGFYVTYDRMQNWDHLNHMAIGQFYHVAVDSRRPYRVYGGLQDNGTWGGPSVSLNGGLINEDWLAINGGDGFVCRVDPFDPDLVYFEIQDGGMARRNLRTGAFAGIRPQPPQGAMPFRFNWNTPFILSAHNAGIFYCGGNCVFRSVKRGDDLKVISPEITRTKRGSATALAESPRNPDVLWAGSDDGFLWVTRDSGQKWANVTENVLKAGLPGHRWVATVEASRFVEGRAYVVFDGHRSDDDQPYVFVTEDFGATWKPIAANLPWGFTRVCREDVQNPDLLFVGTEFGAWASTNRGGRWTKISNNLPTVAVHEFAVHPTAGEVVIATHGRSLWVADIKALRQMTPKVLAEAAHLYEPNAVVRWRTQPGRGSMYGNGSRRYAGENPPPGAFIYYSLTKKADKMSLKIVDITGKAEWDLAVSGTPGLHRIAWDLQGASPQPATYRVALTVDGKEYSQALKIEADPNVPAGAGAEEPAGEKKGERIDD